jgi:hypothetical protein
MKGLEKDKYDTYFVLKTTFKQLTFTLKFIGSVFILEQEHFDILANIRLGEVDANIGSETIAVVAFTRGIGSQLNHARNDLDALIVNAEIKGFMTGGKPIGMGS